MSDDVRYVWFDRDGDIYRDEPDDLAREYFSPFTRYRLEPDPEPEPVPDEPTKPYAVVEVDGSFENSNERVRVVRSFLNPGELPQYWVELVDGPQKFYVWTWEFLSRRNPKIIFEGADL